MKQKFLALVEEVKETQVTEELQQASTEKEMSAVWYKFLDDNHDLCTRIKNWANEFKENDLDAIFAFEEEIKNPLEIVAIIYIIADERVCETQIFEDWEELVTAVRNINNKFAIAVADCIDYDYIHFITAETIFYRI